MTPDRGITVITAHTLGMEEVGRLARLSWGAYAARHGYRFLAPALDGLEEGRHPSWVKLRLLQAVIARGEIAVWADADSVVVNAEITVESILDRHPQDILVGQDPAGICCAHLLVRPTPCARRFLEAWWTLGEVASEWRPQAASKWEQDALKALARVFPSVQTALGLLAADLVCQGGEPSGEHWSLHVSGGDTRHQARRLTAHGWKVGGPE